MDLIEVARTLGQRCALPSEYPLSTISENRRSKLGVHSEYLQSTLGVPKKGSARRRRRFVPPRVHAKRGRHVFPCCVRRHVLCERPHRPSPSRLSSTAAATVIRGRPAKAGCRCTAGARAPRRREPGSGTHSSRLSSRLRSSDADTDTARGSPLAKQRNVMSNLINF